MTTSQAPAIHEPLPPERLAAPAWHWWGRLSTLVDWLLILGAAAVLGFGQTHTVYGDAVWRRISLVDLLKNHMLDRHPYSLVGPIFSAPLWEIDPKLIAYYNCIVAAVAFTGAWLLLRGRTERVVARHFILLCLAGSMIAPAVGSYYGELFTVAGQGIGLLAVVRRGDTRTDKVIRWVGWVAVVLGTANTPASLPALALVTLAWAWRNRRLRYGFAAVAAALMIWGEAWARRGSPFDSGYEVFHLPNNTPMPYVGVGGFSYPFFFGLISIVFSFGKGILWFLPGLVLPARRRLAQFGAELGEAYRLWMFLVGGLVLLYSSWWAWHGAWFWGPRFFLAGILPAAAALAACLADRAARPLVNLASLVVLALSCWIGANSLMWGHDLPKLCQADNYQLEHLCHYTPEYSSLWYPLVHHLPLPAHGRLIGAFYLAVFLWLAAPVVGRLLRQAAEWAFSGAIDLRGWRI